MAPPGSVQRQLEEARFFVVPYNRRNEPTKLLLRFFAPDNTLITNATVNIVTPQGRKLSFRTDNSGEVIFSPAALGRYYVSVSGYRIPFNSFNLSPSIDRYNRQQPRISQKQPASVEVIPESATAQRRAALRARRAAHVQPRTAQRRQPQVPTDTASHILASYKENAGSYEITFRAINSFRETRTGGTWPISRRGEEPGTVRSIVTVGPGRRAKLIAFDGKRRIMVEGLTVEGPRGSTVFRFTPPQPGRYRLVSLEGFARVNPLEITVPTQEQLAERKREEYARQLAYEQNQLVIELKGQQRALQARYSGNPEMAQIIRNIYAYYVRQVGQITTGTGLRQFRSDLRSIATRVNQIAQRHIEARALIARNFGEDKSSGSRYWQILGTPTTGLQAVLYRALRSGDVSFYSKFIRFLNMYASASKSLAEKRTALLDSEAGRLRYGVLIDRLAATYKKALRDIARYDAAELSRLDTEIRGISV